MGGRESNGGGRETREGWLALGGPRLLASPSSSGPLGSFPSSTCTSSAPVALRRPPPSTGTLVTAVVTGVRFDPAAGRARGTASARAPPTGREHVHAAESAAVGEIRAAASSATASARASAARAASRGDGCFAVCSPPKMTFWKHDAGGRDARVHEPIRARRPCSAAHDADGGSGGEDKWGEEERRRRAARSFFLVKYKNAPREESRRRNGIRCSHPRDRPPTSGPRPPIFRDDGV